MSERSLIRTFYDFPGKSSRSAATTGIRQGPAMVEGGHMTGKVVVASF